LEQWFGNPSSDHAYGERPRQAVARAREQVAALIGANADEIVFTGSGSETDQLAIRGAAWAAGTPCRAGGGHLPGIPSGNGRAELYRDQPLAATS
jgi:cysteine sulfinate desulfinase/cysteine desulfurase-like protein